MFIISPRIGLGNQIYTIVKGILLAIKYNRNIYIDKFQIDLNSGRLCNINEILDIKKINIFLQTIIKTNIEILDTIDENIINTISNYCLPNIDYTKISTITYINNYIEINSHMNIIYLGNIVSLDLFQSFGYIWNVYTDTNFYYLLMNNISFHKKFYILKDKIKEELNLNNYNCVHLRIEDDAINHFYKCYHNLTIEEYNNNLLKFYTTNMPTQNITYICSGIINFDNNINLNYYNDLMKNNKLLCDKQNIVLDTYYTSNRELIAIVDLLLAFDSTYFIGYDFSSFTQLIKCNFIFQNKKYITY